MTQLIIPSTECPLVANHSKSFADAIDRAQRRVLEPRAKNTQRVYRQAWHRWDAHCNRLHVRAWPLEPTHLIYYLESLTDLAPNTVRLHLSALCARDVELRITTEEHPLSLRKHPIVIRWLSDWGRDHPIDPRRQAPALTRTELERIIVAAQERGTRGSRPAHLARYARDRCILLFGLTGGFRGAELAELEFGDVLQLERGLQVKVRRSKTDQHGRSRLKGLHPQGTLLRCPVDAWRAWLRVRGDWAGPAFVQIHRDGSLERTALSADAIRRMVTARAAAAGLAAISSHSMRASFITLSRQKGAALERIAAQTGHRSLDTTARYCRQVDLWDMNPSAGMLDGE